MKPLKWPKLNKMVNSLLINETDKSIEDIFETASKNEENMAMKMDHLYY